MSRSKKIILFLIVLIFSFVVYSYFFKNKKIPAVETTMETAPTPEVQEEPQHVEQPVFKAPPQTPPTPPPSEQQPPAVIPTPPMEHLEDTTTGDSPIGSPPPYYGNEEEGLTPPSYPPVPDVEDFPEDGSMMIEDMGGEEEAIPYEEN